MAAVLKGQEEPLAFTVYVPPGYEGVGGSHVPNVQATRDPGQTWTASFMSSQETWGLAI